MTDSASVEGGAGKPAHTRNTTPLSNQPQAGFAIEE
jgi:hypothetical protein